MTAEWQPIETAPKDGTEIILCDSLSYAGYWENDPNYWQEIGWQEADSRQGHFISRHPQSPTHWMPLPEPPEDKP